MNTFIADENLLFGLSINDVKELIIGKPRLLARMSEPGINKDSTTIVMLPWNTPIAIDSIPSVYDSMLYQVFFQAVVWHGDQRYGNTLYADHLREVWLELINAGASEFEQMIGILHDVGEDVRDGLEKVRSKYGDEVYAAVDACSGFGKNRAERSKRIHDLLLHRPLAVNAKIADRIVNMRNSVNNPKLAAMYASEIESWSDILALPNVLSHLRESFVHYSQQLQCAIHGDSYEKPA